jgi:hypothetical protein
MDALTTFERSRIDRNRLNGKIINESRSFTLIAVEYDLAFDGFQIIRNRDITKKLISDSSKYCAVLMKKEGTWITKLPRGLKNLNIDSWGTIFIGIKSDVLIVENERASGEFYIGTVVSVGSRDVTIHVFDGVGQWGEVATIPFSKITTCKFLDRYSSTHAKYLKWDVRAVKK